MVERPLCMRKVWGSIPHISIIQNFWKKDTFLLRYFIFQLSFPFERQSETTKRFCFKKEPINIYRSVLMPIKVRFNLRKFALQRLLYQKTVFNRKLEVALHLNQCIFSRRISISEKCQTITVTSFCQSHFEWPTFCALCTFTIST